MKNTKKKIPLWILIVTILFASLGFIVSMVLLFKPENAIKTVDLSTQGIDYLIQMWAVRQFTVGFIFLYSVIRKSIPMLKLSYIFYLVMNIGDIIIGVIQNDNSLYIGASFMVVFSLSLLYFINKLTIKQKE